MAFKKKSFWVNDDESSIVDADKFWNFAEKVMLDNGEVNCVPMYACPAPEKTKKPDIRDIDKSIAESLKASPEKVLIPACQARKEATDTMYRNIVNEINKAISEGETYCIYKTGSDVPEWIRKELSELGYEVVLTMKQKVIIKW